MGRGGIDKIKHHLTVVKAWVKPVMFNSDNVKAHF